MTHIPVLLKEAISGLNIEEGKVVLDTTFGGGGHSREICKIIGRRGRLIALDADVVARDRVTSDFNACSFELVITNFKEVGRILVERGIAHLDAALFDLGLSSFQLEESGRGFTFQRDEPLRMTFSADKRDGELTAEEIVNDWDEKNIADVIYGYGGEQFARRIARRVVEARKIAPIKTTFSLVRIISEAVPDFYKNRKIHFATKTFQAIRMAVNDEMGALRGALADVWPILRPGGRLAVISFHELEDRAVKTFFRDRAKEGGGIILTKKPITPTDEEVSNNPRSRSAKLRIGEKTNFNA